MDDGSVERAQYRQQMLISLNREIARQLLQGLDCAAGADAPDSDCEQAEAQDDFDRLAATLSSDAKTAAPSALPQHIEDVPVRNAEADALATTSTTGPSGDVAMCADATAAMFDAPTMGNAPADVTMQEAETHAVTTDAPTIVLFLRRGTSPYTLPVYINASASVQELEALLQAYRVHPSKHVLLVGGAPIRRDASLASQGIQDRTVIVYQANSER